MLLEIPTTRVRSRLKAKADLAIQSSGLALLWLNYELFMRKLMKMAADNAKAERSSVIRRHHIEAAKKKILCSSRG